MCSSDLSRNALKIPRFYNHNNRIVIATDADVDGMHIRLLLLTFFLQFFPELVKNNHVYILQTPLFRVRNKKETIYCYNDMERQVAMYVPAVKPTVVGLVQAITTFTPVE